MHERRLKRHGLDLRSAAVFTAFVTIAGLGGCASLDSREDVARAASLVEERSGMKAAWDALWEGAAEAGVEGGNVGGLTVERAVALALRNNREIRAEVERIGAARADLVQAGLLPNPVLSLVVRFPDEGATFIGGQVMQQFAALWLRGDRMRAADARLNEAVLNTSDKALRLAADVQRLHATLVSAEREAALVREAIQIVERSVGVMDQRLRAGEGTTLDVARMRQQRVLMATDLGKLERSIASQRREMLRLLGASAEEETLVTSLVESPMPALQISEDEAVNRAMAQRLDVAASRAVAEAGLAELNEQERSVLRDLSIGIDAERDEDRVSSFGPAIELSIPIFDTNAAQVARAGSLARAALWTHEAVVHRAIAQARQAWIDVTHTDRLLAVLRDEAIPLATEVHEQAARAVSAGVADTTVLLEAQRELVAVRREVVQLELELALARVELIYAIGGR